MRLSSEHLLQGRSYLYMVALVQQRPEWNVEMPMYVTYSDLIQIGIFIVALVGLCYTIFGKRK